MIYYCRILYRKERIPIPISLVSLKEKRNLKKELKNTNWGANTP